MMAARQATASLIWANNALLLCLSLIPFATAYVGATHISPLATMIYAALQFACGLAFMLTYSTIVAQRRDDAEFMAAARARRLQNRAAIVVYLRLDPRRRDQPGERARPVRRRRGRLRRAGPVQRGAAAALGALRGLSLFLRRDPPLALARDHPAGIFGRQRAHRVERRELRRR